MATPREDWEFVKKEFNVLKKFLKKYFKERGEDSDFEHTVAVLEFGPFKWAKLGIAIIATVACILVFHLYRSWAAIWVILLIFFIFYELLFEEKWVMPIIRELFGFFMQIPVLIFDTVKSIIMYFKDAIVGIFKSKEE